MGYLYKNANYGDYYGYQAGGFGSFLGSAIRAVGSVLPGPVGAIAKVAGSAIAGKGQKPIAQTIKASPAPIAAPVPQIPTPGPIGAIQRFVPGGATGMMPAQLYRGYHYNKAYMRYLRAQQEGRFHQDPMEEPRVKNQVVKNRRMNPANPRALRRAIRREQAFVALAKRTLKGTGVTVRRTASFARKRK